MRGSSVSIGVLLFLGLATPAVHAAKPSGEESPAVPVQGSRHPFARAEFDEGRAEPNTFLAGAGIVFRRTKRQQEDLEALLSAQAEPLSPSYRHWITPEEFGARFGPSADAVAAVAGWLRSRGFTVHDPPPSRTWLPFSGTFAQVESAFHTEMHRYVRKGRWYFANSTELSVPAALTGAVAGFRSLDDFRPEPRITGTLGPEFTSSLTGKHFLAPADFAVIYDLEPLYAAGLDGTGQTLAVVGQTQIDQADVDAFRAASGLAPGLVDMVLVPNSGNSVVSPGDVLEADLDVEWSGAVAKGATVVYVYTGSSSNYNVFNSLVYAVDQNLAPVLSISYGDCEAQFGAGLLQQAQAIAQQANAQGQTIVAASGDLGPADCDASGATAALHGLAVDAPASVPEVTGMGGTEFTADSSTPSSYWNAANGAGEGSAISYIPEQVWNETSVLGTLSATGGGASTFFAKPAWQTGPGVPADGHRDVPDLSFNAAVAHDGYLICSQGSCVDGYRRADETLTVVGGTSACAPAFAGMLTILNEATISRLGNVNPTLYQLAVSAPAAFHPTPAGNNFVPCQAGSPNCPKSAPLEFGFSASGAYNQASGLGSIDARALATSWPGYVSRTATVAVVAPASTAVPVGTAVSLAATVTPASGAGTPTGTVQLLADGTGLGAPVALSGGEANFATSALGPGSHSLAVLYSGDSSFLPSTSAAVPETVIGYIIALNPPSLTIARGGSASSTVTLSAAGDFSGSVGLSCTVPANAALNCSLSPTSVTLSDTAPTAAAIVKVSAGMGTASASVTGKGPGHGRLAFGALAALAAALVLGGSQRPRARRLFAFALLAWTAAALACGAALSSGPQTATYVVEVSGSTAGGLQSLSLNVNVE